jgi:hypothetical protein
MERELPQLPKGSEWRREPVQGYTILTPVTTVGEREYQITGFSPYLLTPSGSLVQLSSVMLGSIERVIDLVEKHDGNAVAVNREFLLG